MDEITLYSVLGTFSSAMTPAIIRIHGAALYAHHGVGAEERALGGRYEFDLEMELDIAAAAAGDDVAETVDYSEAYALVHRHLTMTSRHLLETLVVEIVALLLEAFPRLTAATVRLRKLSVPIAGVIGAVELELRQERGR